MADSTETITYIPAHIIVLTRPHMAADEELRRQLLQRLNDPPSMLFCINFVTSGISSDLVSHRTAPSSQLTDAPPLKKRKTSTSPCASLASLACPIITNGVCPFLDLPSHMRLARTSRYMRLATGLPDTSASFAKIGAWDKHVSLPCTTTVEQFMHFCGFARPSSLTCPSITDAGMKCLRSLPLRTLDLSFAKITNAGLDQLQYLSSLKALNLTECGDEAGIDVSDEGLAALQHLIDLESLVLPAHLNLTDSCLSYLQSLRLTALVLRGMQLITGAGFSHLHSMPLRILDLSHCDLMTDVGLSHLSYLPLQTLNLFSCVHITDFGLDHLRHLSLLQVLDLSNCNLITDIGLGYLQNLPLLDLKLASCINISDMGVAYLQKMPLRCLSLSACAALTDMAMYSLREVTTLAELHLPHLPKLTDVGVSYLQTLFVLRHLDLSDCNISDAGLHFLQQMSLEHLQLMQCTLLTDVGLEYLRELPLEYLSLEMTMTDIGLDHLRHLRGLRTLLISHCHGITEAGLELLHCLPNIRLVGVARCRNITLNATITGMHTHVSSMVEGLVEVSLEPG